MPKAYYSTVIPHEADAVWEEIRPFDHYSWAGIPGTTIIEDGRAADEVGSIRCFSGPNGPVRQVLIAHSNPERSYSYAFVSAAPMGMRNYRATIRVAPVVDCASAFVEWRAEFDMEGAAGDAVARQLERDGLAVWLAALGEHMRRIAAAAG